MKKTLIIILFFISNLNLVFTLDFGDLTEMRDERMWQGWKMGKASSWTIWE